MSSFARKKSRHLFRKIVSLFFLITLCLFLFLILFFRFFLPQEKIKLFTERSISQALEKPVNIQELKVNPFGSIKIQNLSIGQYTAQEQRIDTLFKVKKIMLKYKFFSLFKRRLWITDVLIDSPEFRILPDEQVLELEDKKNLGKIQPKPVRKANAPVPLPFTFLMSRFELKNFTFSLISNNTEEKANLSLQGLYLNISKVNLPRDFQRAKHWIRGEIQLYTQEGSFTFRSKDFSYQGQIDMVIAGIYQTLTRWNVTGSIKIGKEGWEKSLWPSLSLDIEGRNFAEILTINKASLHTEKLNLINLTGSIINLNTLKTYEDLLADFNLNLHEKMNINGFLNPVEGRIYGMSDSLKVEVESRLKVDRFLMSSDSSLIENGFFNVNVTGMSSLVKIKEIEVKGEFGFNSFQKSINDTLELKTGVLSGIFTVVLDNQVFPHTGRLNCRLDDLVEGVVDLNVKWTREGVSLSGGNNIVLEAGLKADSLDLAYLPFSIPEIKGIAAVNFSLHSKRGEQNRVELTCRLDSLKYNQELIGTGIHSLNANLFFQTDSTLSQVVLDSCILGFDQVLDCELQGYYKKETGGFHLSLQKAVIDNAKISSYLSDKVSKNIEFSGSENIQATLQSGSLHDTHNTSFTCTIDLQNAGFSFFPEQIFSNNTQGSINFQGSLENIEGEGSFLMGNILIPEWRSFPLKNSTIDIKGSLNFFDTLLISTAKLSFPSLGFRSDIKGSVQHLQDASPLRFKGGAFFDFDSPDTVEIVNDIFLKGRMLTNLQAETYDSTHGKVHITGHLESESLAINSKDRFLVKNIKSSVPLSIDFDKDKKSLVISPSDTIHLRKDYKSKRALYQSLIPEMGRLTMESVEIFNYQIDKIDTDILCIGNRIQIPWICIDLFGGNIAGDLHLDLNSGELSDMTYTITGNANRINSAVISRMEQREEKKSELDATFKFNGRGLDISKMIDISGYFHIINLGSDFASNLLSSIDPSGTDRSIKMTKQLINTGWKPGMFSFELRHGYVYPSFNLHQPWFSPVRLPERLEYGRLPLSFFLKRK